MKTFRSHLKTKLKNKKFAAQYEIERKLLSIAIIIAKERSSRGFSQSELAEKANITQQQLSKIENGQNCNILTFLKVSKALGLSVEIRS